MQIESSRLQQPAYQQPQAAEARRPRQEDEPGPREVQRRDAAQLQAQQALQAKDAVPPGKPEATAEPRREAEKPQPGYSVTARQQTGADVGKLINIVA